MLSPASKRHTLSDRNGAEPSRLAYTSPDIVARCLSPGSTQSGRRRCFRGSHPSVRILNITIRNYDVSASVPMRLTGRYFLPGPTFSPYRRLQRLKDNSKLLIRGLPDQTLLRAAIFVLTSRTARNSQILKMATDSPM